MRFYYAQIIALLLALNFSPVPYQTWAQEFVGHSQAYRAIDVAMPQDGIIAAILVRAGAQVHKGQILARLDSRILQATLQIALARARNQGEIRSCQAEVALKQATVERLQKLQQTRYARPTEMARAQADLAIAQARLLAAREQQAVYQLQVTKIQEEIKQRELKSPTNGVVRQLYRQEGESVTRAEPRIMQILEMHHLYVEVYVPLATAVQLHCEQTAQVHFQAPDCKIQGRIVFIDPQADAASATVKVRLLVPNSHGRLKSGVRCRVKFNSP